MEKFADVAEAQRSNDKKNRTREAQASIYPNDKLRVLPTRHQSVGTNSGQILTFYPNKVVDDPLTIALMDELGVDYTIVSEAIEAGSRCNWKGCKAASDGALLCIVHAKEAGAIEVAPAPDLTHCAIKGCEEPHLDSETCMCPEHEAVGRRLFAPKADETKCVIKGCDDVHGDRPSHMCEEHDDEVRTLFAPEAEEAKPDEAKPPESGEVKPPEPAPVEATGTVTQAGGDVATGADAEWKPDDNQTATQ